MEKTITFDNEELERLYSVYASADCSRRMARELIATLLEERKQPKVFSNAPNNADGAVVKFKAGLEDVGTMAVYTRDLPKSPEREIAEREASKQIVTEGLIYIPKDKLADAIEAGINEYKALNA